MAIKLWRGIELLPDDKKFLRHYLPPSSPSRSSWAEAFRLLWLESMDAEPIRYRKQNRGRRTASAWLRETNPNGVEPYGEQRA